MNVDELVRATLRRKVACLVVLLCALAAGTYGVMSTTESYESSAVAVVYPPGAGDIDAKLNPFVNLNDNMGQLAAVAVTQLQSPAAAALVEEAGADSEYTVTSTLGDTSSSLRLSPQLMITTSGSTPEAAQAGAQALLDYSSVALTELQVQTGVRPNTEALITAAVMPQPGTLVPASPLKAAGSYGLAVLVVGLLGIVTVGTVLDRRRTAPTAANSTSPTPVPGKKKRKIGRSDDSVPAVAAIPRAPEPVTGHNGWPVREPAQVSVDRMNFADDSHAVRADTDAAYIDDTPNWRDEFHDADTAAFPVQTNGHAVEKKGAEKTVAERTVTEKTATAKPDVDKQVTTKAASDNTASDKNARSKADAAPSESRAEQTATESSPQRDRVAVKPPGRIHSSPAPKPPSVEDFDPFNFTAPQDPRAMAQRSVETSTDGFPARTTTPVREMEQDIDDYYGVEERVHVPIRSKHHDYPRSSITGGGPRR